MVHPQFKTGIPSLEPEEEEGQHSLGRYPITVLAGRLGEPNRSTRGRIPEIQEPRELRRRG